MVAARMKFYSSYNCISEELFWLEGNGLEGNGELAQFYVDPKAL